MKRFDPDKKFMVVGRGCKINEYPIDSARGKSLPFIFWPLFFWYLCVCNLPLLLVAFSFVICGKHQRLCGYGRGYPIYFATSIEMSQKRDTAVKVCIHSSFKYFKPNSIFLQAGLLGPKPSSHPNTPRTQRSSQGTS